MKNELVVYIYKGFPNWYKIFLIYLVNIAWYIGNSRIHKNHKLYIHHFPI